MTGKIIETTVGPLTVVRLLGKGKSGYSYLAENGNDRVVLKIMHDEPVAYYTFHDKKVNLEVSAYHRLNELKIKIPRLLGYDSDQQFLIKEYIDGKTASDYISSGNISEKIIEQLFDMSKILKSENHNIDYFPSNFVVRNDDLFYIDYEINAYMPEWNLENWGIYYWANSAGMKDYLTTGNASSINEFPEKGLPYKSQFEPAVNAWKLKYSK
jgi:TP53 regulating kinase-like protein